MKIATLKIIKNFYYVVEIIIIKNIANLQQNKYLRKVISNKLIIPNEDFQFHKKP